MNKLYGFKTAPARCGMSESLFRDLCRTGRGPRNSVRIDDSGVAWTEQALIEWLTERKVPAGQPRPREPSSGVSGYAPRPIALAPFLPLGTDRPAVAKTAEIRATTSTKALEQARRSGVSVAKPRGKQPARNINKHGSPVPHAAAPLFRGFGGRGPADRTADVSASAASWGAAATRTGIKPGRAVGEPPRPARSGLLPATKANAAIADSWAEAMAKARGAPQGRRKP